MENKNSELIYVREESKKMSAFQNVLIIISIVALIAMLLLILGLSWGISFQAVAVGGVTCFAIAVASTVIALCIGVVGIFSRD